MSFFEMYSMKSKSSSKMKYTVILKKYRRTKPLTAGNYKFFSSVYFLFTSSHNFILT